MQGYKNKRALKFIVTACVLVSALALLFGQAAAAQPRDVAGHWAEGPIVKWSELGIINSKPDGNFKPNDPITRAELSAIINRIFRYTEYTNAGFRDIRGDEWYARDINIAAAAGYLKGSNGYANPNTPVTRQEAAVMLARAFQLQPAISSTQFRDAAQIASWAREAVDTMAARGYINGRPGNIFAPLDKMTRAEAIKVIDNLLGTLVNKPGSHTFTAASNALVNTGGAVINNAIINGNLYLAPGIDSGTVTLSGCEIKGSLYMEGGYTVILENTRVNGQLVLSRKNGNASVTTTGTATVSETVMKTGATLINNAGNNCFNVVTVDAGVPSAHTVGFTGNFGKITVNAGNININFSSGNVSGVTLQQPGVTVNVAGNATVAEMTLNAAATVNGQGRISIARVNSNGVVLEYEPDEIIKKDTVQNITIINPREGEPGETPGGSDSDTQDPGTGGDDETGGGSGDNDNTPGDTPGGDTGETGTGDGTGDNEEPGEEPGETPGEDENCEGSDPNETPGGGTPGGGTPGGGTPGGGTPGGGTPGGGTPGTSEPRVLSATATVGGQSISAVDQGNGTWVVNLSSVPRDSVFSTISVTATAGTREAIVNCMGIITTLQFSNGYLSFSASQVISKALGFTIPDSLMTVKTLSDFGVSMISVTLIGEGGTTSITVQLNY